MDEWRCRVGVARSSTGRGIEVLAACGKGSRQTILKDIVWMRKGRWS